MKFYTYWRSLAALRVRIVLNLKEVARDDVVIDLLAGQQRSPEFEAVNPQMALPALVLDDGNVLFQSMAILEYLDETYRDPPLMPETAIGRARVRGLSQIAVADGHPLVTPRVRQYLGQELGISDVQAAAWSKHWMGAALASMEGHLARDAATGQFCQGDRVTLADVCLVSQAIGYGYFGGTLEAFPVSAGIHARCMKLDAFARAHPAQQPDKPRD